MRNELTQQEYVSLQQKFFNYCNEHDNITPTEKLVALMRLYEKAHYGVTSLSLSRGYEIDYVNVDGAYYKVKNPVKGAFLVGGDGNRRMNDDPVCSYIRGNWDVISNRMNKAEVIRDRQTLRNIALDVVAHDHATGFEPADIVAKGDYLLEHRGIDTGFGAATGVIAPEYVNMLMEKFAVKSIFKNFARIVPMPSMTFYFPLKTTSWEDLSGDHYGISPTTMPTAEGTAGLEFAIMYNKFLVNGWKYLRHAGLTVELIDMISKYINIREDYINDMRDAMAILWDFSIANGMYHMLRYAKWYRPDTTGPGWADDEYVPMTNSGAEILGVNYKNSALWLDLTPGGNYGLIYEPAITGSNEYKYASGTKRPGSDAGDDVFEFVVALGALLKAKHAKMDFVLMPPKVSEFFFRDPRFLDTTQNTGNPAFQSENGYLGQIAIGGSNSRVDVWEYDPAIFGTVSSADPYTGFHVVFAGQYNSFWNMGIYSPTYMRVDDGYEVKTVGIGNASVLRPNETRVITVGSRGSSFPGDWHGLVMGLVTMTQAHA